jgi:hypothetical protein
MITIPFSFVAEKFGFKVVLWCNMIPRIGLSIWAIVVGTNDFLICINYYLSSIQADITIGHLEFLLPTKAIILGPFLAVLGGECVFQSTVFTLTSALAQEYVERYVRPLHMKHIDTRY